MKQSMNISVSRVKTKIKNKIFQMFTKKYSQTLESNPINEMT